MKTYLVLLFSLFGSVAFPKGNSNVGPMAAQYLDHQMKISLNQKEMIKRLIPEAEERKQITELLRETKTEGMPLPKTKVTGAVLEIMGSPSVRMDLSSLASGEIRIDQTVIDLKKNPSAAEILEKIKPQKKAASMWISEAHALGAGFTAATISAIIGARVLLGVADRALGQPKAKFEFMQLQFDILAAGPDRRGLTSFTCDPVKKTLKASETKSENDSTQYSFEVNGTQMSAQRISGKQSCAAKLEVSNVPGVVAMTDQKSLSPTTTWTCPSGKNEKDFVNQEYFSSLNRCCLDEACENTLKGLIKGRTVLHITPDTSAPVTK